MAASSRSQNDPAIRSALEHLRARRLPEAIDALRRVCASDPRHAQAHSLLGVALLQADRPDDAAAAADRSLELEPRNATFLTNAGGVYRKAGRLADARRALDAALSISPYLAPAVYNLALTLRGLGEHEAAAAQCCRMLQIDPKSADAANQLGLCLLDLHQPTEAAEAFTSALRLRPGWAEAMGNLGRAHLALQRPQEALEWLERASAAAPDDAGILGDYAGALNACRRPDDALKAAERAIALDPARVTLHHRRAFALELLGRLDDAAVAYRRILELDPDDRAAAYHVAALADDADRAAQPRAPAEYVAALFDDYAEMFDEHLVQRLEYHTPRLIRQAVESATPVAAPAVDILDLGCGTGLSGVVFAGRRRRMVGVDLSQKMLDKASQRGIYDELLCLDLVEATRRFAGEFDLVVAADVFVYVGDLSDVFAAVRDALRPGGLFAFSVEDAGDADGFVLQRTRRYAHGRAYVERLAGAAGLRSLSRQECVIRKDSDVGIRGLVVVLRRDD